MKSPKIKHGQTIFWMIILVFLMVSKISVWYYANHFASMEILHRRLRGNGVFYLKNMKIEIPKNCALESPKAPESHVISQNGATFLCATSPISFDLVYLREAMPSVEEFKKIKNLSEKFSESDQYVNVIIGPKIGFGVAESKYYLKHQNVTISSDSQKLATEFADLLINYNLITKPDTFFDKSENPANQGEATTFRSQTNE